MAQAATFPGVARLRATGLLDTIGDTPLLRLEAISAAFPGVEICAKAEYANPGGSVKDRPALSMILEGERSGALSHGRIILDATSGNTGIAYAMIAAARGYRVKLCLPANASPERKRILKAYGAEVVLTDAAEGSDGAIRVCRQIYEADPDRYFYPDQYNNPANWRAHYETTGPEIIVQTGREITHFVAGLGTSGTFMGVTRRLRRELPRIECLAVQPDSPFHGLEGMKHMRTAMVPGIYDEHLADGVLEVATEDAYRMVRRLAREEGVLAGISSGANVHAAVRVAGQLAAQGRSGVVVTILCDGADKYLSEHFWDEE
ncbi:MAG TPA: cysteine synthase family protein [Bryobacteraceae bacterium]|nr:cysteine synthase family protein [Bryobacteraceae bacterium]